MPLPKIYARTFNIVGAFTVAPAVGGRTYKVVGLLCHNNETSALSFVRLRITAAAADLYGGSSGAIMLSGRGDHFILPINPYEPYFEGNAGNGLFLFSQVSSTRVSGIIFYTYEDA